MKNFIFLLSLFLLSSCSKQDENLQLSQQEDAIDKFVVSQTGKLSVVNEGASRVIIEAGTGDAAVKGDSIFFDYAAYIFTSGKGAFFDTNVQSVAAANSMDISKRTFNYGKNIVGGGILLPGLDKGFVGVKKGEHAYIIFSSSNGFGNKSVGNVPKLSPLIFEVWIKSIKKN